MYSVILEWNSNGVYLAGPYQSTVTVWLFCVCRPTCAMRRTSRAYMIAIFALTEIKPFKQTSRTSKKCLMTYLPRFAILLFDILAFVTM
jgi:hypothetical protein